MLITVIPQELHAAASQVVPHSISRWALHAWCVAWQSALALGQTAKSIRLSPARRRNLDLTDRCLELEHQLLTQKGVVEYLEGSRALPPRLVSRPVSSSSYGRQAPEERAGPWCAAVAADTFGWLHVAPGAAAGGDLPS